MNQTDGTDNQGRKGVAYDWYGLYAASQAHDLDGELARLVAAAERT